MFERTALPAGVSAAAAAAAVDALAAGEEVDWAAPEVASALSFARVEMRLLRAKEERVFPSHRGREAVTLVAPLRHYRRRRPAQPPRGCEGGGGEGGGGEGGGSEGGREGGGEGGREGGGDAKLEHYSLLLCHPLTGRQHQIRVHMKTLGHALVGDTRYCSTSRRVQRQLGWCGGRLFLHNCQTAIERDGVGRLAARSRLPPELQLALRTAGADAPLEEVGRSSSQSASQRG